MKFLLQTFAVIIFLAAVANADETVTTFSFKTVDGKTIEYRATSGAPMVINVGSHW